MKKLMERIIAGLSEAPADNRFILGIVGFPAAGKSTLAEGLVAALNECLPVSGKAQILPMDGYHLPNATLDELGLRELKGIPDTFDPIGFVDLLKRVKQMPDQVLHAPAFDRSIDGSIEDAIRIGTDVKVVVAEGNYLLLENGDWAGVSELLNDSWFLDASLETIRPRLIERHIAGGRTRQEAIAKVESTDLPNALLIGKSRARARALVTAVDNKDTAGESFEYQICSQIQL
ncbi:MAG: nucleoside/nucleotide kinase family protein [Cyanobacteria bacterium PR.3.49]|nr:nucleoside/nucleotide kinase family protein [Cyanobacteria bacterium PR.3.49]